MSDTGKVTGVDMVPKALAGARDRAAAAGVSTTFAEGDVTRLEDLGLPDDFTLLLDVGCFHTLPLDRRDGCSMAHSRDGGPMDCAMMKECR